MPQTEDQDDTWKNVPSISPRKLDKLISHCDSAADGSEQSFSPFGVFSTRVNDLDPATRSGATPDAGPLPVTNGTSAYLESSITPVPIEEHVINEGHFVSGEDDGGILDDSHDIWRLEYSPPSSLPLQWPLESTGHGLPYRYALLLDAYVSLVTPTLVPIHDARNPWIQYPAMALHLSRQEGKHHLLHALLAHAAFSLSHRARAPRARSSDPYAQNTMLEDEIADTNETAMASRGYKFYSLATTEMRARIQDGSIGCLDLLTTVLSLLLVEMAQGSSRSWRYHLDAAWKYLQHQNNMPRSVEVWYATQSIHLLRATVDCSTIGDSLNGRRGHVLADNNADNASSIYEGGDTYMHEDFEQSYEIREDVMRNPEYGRTAGATSSIMRTISDIRDLAAKLGAHSLSQIDNTIEVPLRLTRTLIEYQNKSFEAFLAIQGTHDTSATSNTNASLQQPQPQPEELHLRAFKAGAVIYYHQTCDRVPPQALSIYVTVVLSSLRRFHAVTAGGCFTLWPLIIAAMDTVNPEQQAEVMALLDEVAIAGMRDLTNHRWLIRRVWQVRESNCAAEGWSRLDEMRVDWREVMKAAGMDLLVF